MIDTDKVKLNTQETQNMQITYWTFLQMYIKLWIIYLFIKMWPGVFVEVVFIL